MKQCGSIHTWWLLLLLPALTSCGVNPFKAGMIGHSMPVMEQVQPINHQAFVHYLDSAAIDDWEGIWIMIGNNTHCYLAIERVNDYTYESRYTHRIRMWFDVDVLSMYTIPSGLVLGYIEQGLVSDLRNITLFYNMNWPQIFNEEVTTTARLSEDRTLILLKNIEPGKHKIINWGMKRIYPVRSHDEEGYRVRYL